MKSTYSDPQEGMTFFYFLKTILWLLEEVFILGCGLMQSFNVDSQENQKLSTIHHFQKSQTSKFKVVNAGHLEN